MEKSFLIKEDDYEGPIDTLLGMVESRELNVSRVSLSKISDEFVTFVQGLERKDLEYISHFIYVASILLLLKSKSLINVIELSRKEEEDLYELETQLMLYKTIRNVTKENSDLFKSKTLFTRNVPKREVEFREDSSLNKKSIKDFAESSFDKIKDYIKKIPTKELDSVISLEDMMSRIKDNIIKTHKFIFSSSNKKTNSKELIVSFLAILELIKLGNIDIRQDEMFGDIEVFSKK